MPTFLRQFTRNPDGPASKNWQKVEAASHQAAVFTGFDPKRSGPGIIHCLVAEDRATNKHKNGMPFCVHRFEVQVGEAVTTN